MNVRELIAALQTLPQEAEVFVSDGPCEGQTLADERDPFCSFESCGGCFCADGTLCYPHGRVKL